MSGLRRISQRVEQIDINGYLSPFHFDNRPALLQTPYTDADEFVLIFSTREKLDTFVRAFGLQFDKIVKLTDGQEFLASLTGYRFMVDPVVQADASLHFYEIQIPIGEGAS